VIAKTKLTTGVIAGVLGLAVTGAAAFAAFEPPAAPAASADITTGAATVQTDKGGAHDRLKDVLDTLVQNNTITQSQEDAILAAVKTAHKDNDGKGGALHRVLRGLMKMSADYLGMTPKDLHAKLASGQSLGQIADAAGNGKSRDGLISALTTGVTAEVDKLVTDGKITADQAAKINAELPGRIAKFVDRVPKAKT
jgi:polyhydroxyalkanoate synthesis regulator phasin